MSKRASFILLILVLGLSLSLTDSIALTQTQGIKTIEPIRKDDRILILAPHPDDETIACAGIIQQAVKTGAKVRVAYLTNGDHNEIAFIVYEKRLTLKQSEFIHMGEVRRREATKAMKLLGLNEGDLIFLGYPDFGTFTIFSQFWQATRPFKSFLTRISSVPYKENLSFGAPYNGDSILSDIERVLLEYKPNKIFVSHPADTNVDHRSLYLFLQVALRDLNKELPEPSVYPYLIHSVGWPLPRRYHPELSLMPPKQFSDSQINWLESILSPEQLDKKHQAILCYKSQTESSAFYLLSFARKNELFGDYPEVTLSRQMSLKEKAVSFFGFSDMYDDSDIDALMGLDQLVETKGQVSYAVVDDFLLIRVEKTKELSKKFNAIFYLFGHSYKTPFADMPKIRIITKNNKFKVFNARSMIKHPEGVSLDLDSKVLIIKVPLQLLGNPDFILSSIKAHRGILPIDASGFRKLEIQ